ncbi:hypothetical protein ACMYYO_13880 [Dermacoccaceae bacterium W4C1]
MESARIRPWGWVAFIVGAVLIVARATTWIGWSLRLPNSPWLITAGLLALTVAAALLMRRRLLRGLIVVALVSVTCMAALATWVLATGWHEEQMPGPADRLAVVVSGGGFGPEQLRDISMRRELGPLRHDQRVGCISDDALSFTAVRWEGDDFVVLADTTEAGPVSARIAVAANGQLLRITDPAGILKTCPGS